MEPDAWARFCGVCGTTMTPAPLATAGTAGQVIPPAMEPGQVQPYVTGYTPSPAAPALLVPTPAAQAVDQSGRAVYTVPSVGWLGPMRIGAAVSGAFALLPCLGLGALAASFVHSTRLMMDSWQAATVRVPLPVGSADVTMNFIDLLKIRELYDKVIYWDERLWMVFATWFLFPWILLILGGAIFGLLLATIYNMVGAAGGGVQVTVEPVRPRSGQVVAAPQPWPVGPPR